MNIRVKYADFVRPRAKEIAAGLIVQIKEQTGKDVVIKKLTLYSDEMRIEFRELKNEPAR